MRPTWWRHQMKTFSALSTLCVGNSPDKGQWRRALMFSLICAWTNGWVNDRDASDLRRHCTQHDVTVMGKVCLPWVPSQIHVLPLLLPCYEILFHTDSCYDITQMQALWSGKPWLSQPGWCSLHHNFIEKIVQTLTIKNSNKDLWFLRSYGQSSYMILIWFKTHH